MALPLVAYAGRQVPCRSRRSEVRSSNSLASGLVNWLESISDGLSADLLLSRLFYIRYFGLFPPETDKLEKHLADRGHYYCSASDVDGSRECGVRINAS